MQERRLPSSGSLSQCCNSWGGGKARSQEFSLRVPRGWWGHGQEAAIRSQRWELSSGPPVWGVGVRACIVAAKTKVHSTLTSLDLRFCCGAELMRSSWVPNTALGTKAGVLGEWVSLPFCPTPSLPSLEAGSHKKEFPRGYSAPWPCDTFWALDSHLGFIQSSPLIHSGYVPNPTR